jgi:hypothetical protein
MDGSILLEGLAVAAQHFHLGAGNHDVAGLHLRHLQHAFDHGQGIGIEQGARCASRSRPSSCSRSLGSASRAWLIRSRQDRWRNQY